APAAVVRVTLDADPGALGQRLDAAGHVAEQLVVLRQQVPLARPDLHALEELALALGDLHLGAAGARRLVRGRARLRGAAVFPDRDAVTIRIRRERAAVARRVSVRDAGDLGTGIVAIEDAIVVRVGRGRTTVPLRIR